MSSAYGFWDAAPEGTRFALCFPRKHMSVDYRYCLSGVWTFEKIGDIYMAGFSEEDGALVIQRADDALIVAKATSEDSSHTYFLNRGDIRSMIKWAEREGVQPQAVKIPKQIEASSTVSEKISPEELEVFEKNLPL